VALEGGTVHVTVNPKRRVGRRDGPAAGVVAVGRRRDAHPRYGQRQHGPGGRSGLKNLGGVPLTTSSIVSNTAQVSGGRSNSAVVLLSYTTVASNATGLWTIDAQPGAVILTGAIVARRGYHGGSGLVGPGMGSRGEGDG